MIWLQNHFTIIEGFPRPDWDTIDEIVTTNFSDRDENDLWCEIACFWVEKIKSALSPDYSVYDSANFTVLTSENREYADTLLKFMEDILIRILKILPGIVSDNGYGKHVILIIDDLDHYYSYISYFYPDEGEFAFSGGAYLNKGYGHFVFPHQEIQSAERVAAHELCHALLDHLPIPLWLNEGITVNIENMIIGTRSRIMDHVMIKEHEEFWDKDKIQEFWSGDSFSRPDEGNHLSYHLSQFLVQSLSKDYKLFKEFANKADYADGGESAAHSVYNNSLGYLIEGLLGNGDWAPK